MGSFGGGLEQITVEMDPRSVLQAVAQMNAAVADMEKGIDGSGNKVNRTWQSISETMLRATDKSKNAADSYVRSLERQAAAVGKSGIDKLNAQMEQAIKNYGYSDTAIKKITESYEKLKKAQESPGGQFKEYGEQIKQFVESPVQGAGVALTGLLEKIGPVGVAIGATAGVFVTAGAAVLESAHSLGEWGIQIRDVELRSGLTAKAIGEFDFAAKAAGTDISFVERTMRGLTVSLEDNGAKGEKAREWLQKWGVDIQGVKSGNVDAEETLLKISEGLDALPPGYMRNAAAIDIFKKAGVDLVPVLSELNENVKRAKELGFGYSAEEVQTAQQLKEETAELDRHWENIKRNVEWLLVKGGTFAIKLSGYEEWEYVINWFNKHDVMASGASDALNKSHAQMVGMGARAADVGLPSAIAGISSDQAAFNKTKEGLTLLEEQAKQTEKADREAYLGMKDNATASSDQIIRAKEAWQGAAQAVKQYAAELKAIETKPKKEFQFMGPVEGQDIIQEHQLAQISRNAATARPLNAGNNLSDVSDWLEKYKEQQKEQESAQKATLSFEQEMIKLQNGPDGELATVKQIYDLRMLAATSALDQYQAGLDYLKQIAEYQSKADKDHQAELDKQTKQQQEILEKEHEQVAKTASGLYGTLLTHPSQFGHQLVQTLQKKATSSAADMLGQATANVLVPGGVKHTDPIHSTDLNTQATIQNSQAVMMMTAHLAAQLGVSAPSLSGISGLPGVSAPSVSAAHNAPSIITIPIGTGGSVSIPSPTFGSGGFSAPSSGSTSSLPYFGASGPLFSGETTSTPSFGGGPVFAGSTNGSTRGGGGFSLPSLLGGFGGGNPASMIGPGGTSGFAGPVGGSSGGGFNLGRVFGGGSGGGFNMGDLYSRTPPLFGGGMSSDNPVSDSDSPLGPQMAPSTGGWTSGVGGSAGAALGGTGLAIAENGLTGRNEGTGKGVAEGAIGGAMVGMQYGGPIGAAIGAAVGAGIGVGEMLAGVMSPWAKAAMYAKQLYGITINDNMQNQIVNIAKGSFGGNIQLAVRSPQVRQMLGLYAAGTGQANAKALMDSTPHGAGLSQQGGVLYQDPSTLYGQSYKYSRSLPTLGGNNTTQTYNSPSGYSGSQPPVVIQNLTLPVGEKSVAAFLTGQVVTTDYVSDAYAEGLMNSNNRVSNSATLQEPGLITS